jgi:RND family efflux transporter MFP subunit
VVAGKTLLFVVDDEKLRKEVEMARQTLGAARFAREQSAAGLQRAEVELRRAEKDLGRFRSLRDENAVSLSRYDDAEALRDQLLSLRRASAKGLALAGEEERKAAAALRIAERNLRDARAYAPLSGRVSRRMAEPGEMGSKGKPVIRIDDVSDIEASAFLPGQVYPRVLRGKTRIRVGVQGLGEGDPGRWLGEAPVSYKSPVVDPTLRTFEVKCRLSGDGERIVPGCLVDLRILLGERRGPGVPSEAVLERGGRKVVFRAEGRVARMVPVETGLESEGWTEIRKGNLRPGSPVVTKGQFLLNDGSPLRIGGTASGGADGKGQP